MESVKSKSGNRKSRQTIGLIICYLGELPWYFSLFLRSVEFNQSIDFFLITDDLNYKKPLPANFKIIHKSKDEINRIARQKLGFDVDIQDPYKLCDFKPTFGLLFSEVVGGYDFWGYGDIDVIYGNIRKFITPNILNEHDVISVRHDFLTGQFLLLRNNDKINRLFMLSRDFRKVLSDRRHFCFDETNFKWNEFTAGMSHDSIYSEIESMTHLVKRLALKNYLKVFFDFLIVEGLPGKLKWSRGKLIYKRKYEVLLYHLVLFKNVYFPTRPIDRIPDSFSISRTRIYFN